MPTGSQTRRQIRQKRHTWPRSNVDKLETIIESPRTPTKQKFPSGDGNRTSQGSPGGIQEINHSQLLWYSQVLSDSQKERLKLSDKIAHLERVYEKQKSKNTRLQQEVLQWQVNFDTIQVELCEAVQEIEDARSYVRTIESSNANLKYVLAQMKEEQAMKERRWQKRLGKYMMSLFESRSSTTETDEKTEALGVARAATPEPFKAEPKLSNKQTTLLPE